MNITRTTLFVFGSLLGLVSCLPSSIKMFPTPTPVPPINHVIDNTVDIEQTWALDNVYVIWNEQDTTLDSLMGKTCFLGDLGKRDLYKNFICLDSQSGQLLWAKETGANSTLAVTRDGIFIAYSKPTQVRKYDLETGDLVWKKPLSGTGSIYLYYLDNQVQVSTTNPETLWVLDRNAEVIRRMKDHRIFFSTKDETYVNLNGLQVFRTGTAEVLWKYTDTNYLTQAPLFREDKIFLRNGANFSGTAYALDPTSGALLWNVQNIIGNLAYSPDKKIIYALHEDGNLVAIDENTGKESVIAEFSSGPFIFFDGVDTCAYQLAYDDEEHLLMVYLGDSRQLFAFSEK